MDFPTYLKNCAKEISETVSTLLSDNKIYMKSENPILKDLFNVFAKSTKGGKRTRGALVKIGYFLATHKENKEILKIAGAYEILQTSLLIHDDIIDKSLVRRGQPSVYNTLGANHYGISQAICLGDIGLFLANKIIADCSFPPTVKEKAISLFSQIVLDVYSGEMLDVAISRISSIKEEKDVIDIHRLKTASYSVVGPLILGATLGGASKTMIETLEKYGEYIGIAYQIHDDILGVFGNEKEVGKSTVSDIKENKNTLLITYALTHATSEQKKILDIHYGHGTLSQKNYETIKQIFIDTGSLSYSKDKAKDYVEKGKKIIPRITTNTAARNLLTQFADFVIERQK